MNLTDTKKNEKLRQTIRKTTPVIHILHLANRHDHLSKFETQLELLKNSARELGLTVLKIKKGRQEQKAGNTFLRRAMFVISKAKTMHADTKVAIET